MVGKEDGVDVQDLLIGFESVYRHCNYLKGPENEKDPRDSFVDWRRRRFCKNSVWPQTNSESSTLSPRTIFFQFLIRIRTIQTYL